MKTQMKKYDTIDAYITSFPKPVQEMLESLRQTIKSAAPTAEEVISYGIPTYKLNGNLVHFAAYEHHIGFYPGAGGIKNFEDEISTYKHAKGSVQFPLDGRIPLGLVKKIVKFRVKQNLEGPVKKNYVRKTLPETKTYLSSYRNSMVRSSKMD